MEYMTDRNLSVAAALSGKSSRPTRQVWPRDDHFQELFENAGDFMYTTDLGGNLTGINRAGEQLTGFTRDEVVGSNIARLVAPEHLARAMQKTDPETSDATPTPYELDIVAKDGRRIPLEVLTRLIYKDGRPVGVHGIARDITSRRQADGEVRRREHLETLNAIIATADAAPDLPKLLEVALDRTLEVLGLGVGGIWAGDDYVVRGLPPERGATLIDFVNEISSEITLTRAVEDWRGALSGAEGSLGDAWTRLGIRASLAVPILVGGRCVGVFAAASTSPRSWPPAEITLVEAVAQQVGATVEGLRLFHEVQLQAELMGRLVVLSDALNRPSSVAGVVAAIGQAAVSLSGAQGGAISFHHPDGTTERAWSQGVSSEYIARMVTPEITGAWAGLGRRAAPVWMNLPGGIAVEVTGPILIPDVEELSSADPVRMLVEREGIRAIAVWPLTYEGRVIASVSCHYHTPHAWSRPEKEVIQMLMWQAASALENARLYEAQIQRAKELEQAYIEMVLALSRAMDARDAYTADHSERLAAWGDAVAQSLGLGEEEIRDIRWGALLHDIGKLGVPDGILRKAGLLTAEEWEAMRQHPSIGEGILLPAARLQGVARIVRHHHERWDGTGYPDHLQGTAIPLGARILAVVDAYGAIIDDRPYKPAHTHGEAVAELRRCAGTQFDPQVVEAFCRVIEDEKQHAS